MINSLVGEHIILRKAKPNDYNSMLKNIWSDEEVYKWMLFKPTLTIDDAIDRTNRSIEFQKDHYAYFVALKDTDEAIGYCGIKEYEKDKYEECGICIARQYQNKGYGKEILELLLDLAFNKLNGSTFRYGYFTNNIKSKKLANHFNFKYDSKEELIRPWDNKKFIVELCLLEKEEYIKMKNAREN